MSADTEALAEWLRSQVMGTDFCRRRPWDKHADQDYWRKQLASIPLDAVRAQAKAEVLREAADEHEAQLVCCDVYERLRDKPSGEWNDAERIEYRSHAICYWSAACAEGDRARADQHAPTTSDQEAAE